MLSITFYEKSGNHFPSSLVRKATFSRSDLVHVVFLDFFLSIHLPFRNYTPYPSSGIVIITSISRNQMNMNMGNRLSSFFSNVDSYIKPIRVEVLLDLLFHFIEHKHAG